MTLDQLIRKKGNLLTISQKEFDNIKGTLKDLKGKLQLTGMFHNIENGGSYKRKTMIKGYSDIDLFCHYLGDYSPQSILDRIKDSLTEKYCHIPILIDFPSVVVKFKRVDVEIIPIKKNKVKGSIIPANNDNWKETDLVSQKRKLKKLLGDNSDLLCVIKVLKYWNIKYQEGLFSHQIEQIVYSQFHNVGRMRICEYMMQFFKGNLFGEEAQIIEKLIELSDRQSPQLRTKWKDFIK